MTHSTRVETTLTTLEKKKELKRELPRSRKFLLCVPGKMHSALVVYAVDNHYPTLSSVILEALREYMIKHQIESEPTRFFNPNPLAVHKPEQQVQEK